ncbi:hypothetical protein [Prochlorococcus marinus]|nr:hypothetical protein [Prochlorococcus marinus]
MDAELYAEYVNQECPERRLEGAATSLKEGEGVKFWHSVFTQVWMQ